MMIRDFILARLAEDGTKSQTERDRREIAAKRAVLREYDSANYDPTSNYVTVGVRGVGTFGRQFPAARIICSVAAVYADHTDFDPIWQTIAATPEV